MHPFYRSRQCSSLRSSLTAGNHRFVEVINETEDHSIGTREGATTALRSARCREPTSPIASQRSYRFRAQQGDEKPKPAAEPPLNGV